MQHQTIEYFIEETPFIGHVVHPKNLETKRPIILVVHAWKGQDDFARHKAQAIAELGYIGFAIDLYGEGKNAKNNEEAASLMLPLFLDRPLLQKRMMAAYEVARDYPLADANQIGVIGFCFGGLASIELFRSGVALKGAVSFHATLSNQRDGKQAKTVPIAKNIQGSLLMLHGHRDPLVSEENIRAIQKELTEAQVDWQMHVYGQAMHAFTDPNSQAPESGLLFNSQANQRSWKAMCDLFLEVMS